MSRKAALDLGEVIFLVLVDKNVPACGEKQSCARDLGGLIDTIAVREDGGVAERPEPRDHVHRAWIQVTLERYGQDRAIDVLCTRLVRERAPKASEGLGEINDARLRANLLVQRPKTRCSVGRHEARDGALDVVLDTVVVDERVVHVQKEDELSRAMLSRGWPPCAHQESGPKRLLRARGEPTRSTADLAVDPLGLGRWRCRSGR